MILTCPNCSAKFAVPDGALPPEGHEVKCSKCAHVWFQVPDADELNEIIDDLDQVIDQMEDEALDARVERKEDDDAALEAAMQQIMDRDDLGSDIDVPEGIRPNQGSFAQEITKLQSGKHARHGYMAAAGVFVLVFLLLLMVSGPVAKAVPGMKNFYTAVGLQFEPLGKGLVFDKLVTKIEVLGKEKEKIYVEGNIINLTDHIVSVPLMEITLRDDADAIVGTWLAKPPEETIDAEATLSFQAGYDNTNLEAAQASVRFVLGE